MRATNIFKDIYDRCLLRKKYSSAIYGLWMLNTSLSTNVQKKRALLSYITTPFTKPKNDQSQIRFANIGVAKSIVYVLNQLGYIVDVIDWKDKKFVPRRKYNLFIGHGGEKFKKKKEKK